jgi:serine/threonine protein kinase
MHAMSLEDIKCYLRSLFDALAHVHAHGIIHRDVKPSNFLYDVKKRKGVLVDFGLAQVINLRLFDFDLWPCGVFVIYSLSFGQRGWETDGDADYSTATATTAAFTVPSPRKRSRATALQTEVVNGRKTLGAATAQLNKSTDTPTIVASQSPFGYNPRRPPGYYAKDPR